MSRHFSFVFDSWFPGVYDETDGDEQVALGQAFRSSGKHFRRRRTKVNKLESVDRFFNLLTPVQISCFFVVRWMKHP